MLKVSASESMHACEICCLLNRDCCAATPTSERHAKPPILQRRQKQRADACCARKSPNSRLTAAAGTDCGCSGEPERRYSAASSVMRLAWGSLAATGGESAVAW